MKIEEMTEQCKYCMFYQSDGYIHNECFLKNDNDECINFLYLYEIEELEEPEDY